jgi:hypothetical protein
MFRATRISGLYSQRREYDGGRVHITFVVDELRLKQAFIQAVRSVTNSNIPATLLTHLSIYIILAIDRVVK